MYNRELKAALGEVEETCMRAIHAGRQVHRPASPSPNPDPDPDPNPDPDPDPNPDPVQATREELRTLGLSLSQAASEPAP